MLSSPAAFDDEDLRALLDAAPDATLVVREDGIIEYANQRCWGLLGYCPDELIGQPVEILIAEPLREAHARHRDRYRDTPAARAMGVGIELAALRRDGETIPVEISLSPVRTSRHRWICAAMRDVSWRHSREAELLAARRSADEANAAKNEFLASMSHELRTPLNAILGFAQLLQRDKKAPLAERQRGWVDHVLRGGQHLLRLIDDVLDLSRIDGGHLTLSLEPVDVGMVIEEVKATLAPLAERNSLELASLGGSAELPAVQADRTRLAQVLLNYGSNAIKYGRAGGRVVLTAYAVGSPEDASERVRITVSDTGIGIPEDKQPLLFLPFQRAGQETGTIEGTGIGLTICKRLAEAMHGCVGFRSAPGQGSDFWVELPVASVQPERARRNGTRDEDGPSPRPGAAARTVLYIEDNPANLAFMEELLSSYEHIRLLTAPSGELGLELAMAHSPELILVDIHLPGIDGHEVLRRLRAHPQTAGIKVVAVSAVVDKAQAAEFDRYFTKPLQVAMLDAMINEYLPDHPASGSDGAGPQSGVGGALAAARPLPH